MKSKKIIDDWSLLDEPVKCYACGEEEIVAYDQICHSFGWQYDEVQQDEPDLGGGPNILSLIQTKEWFELNRKLDPTYTWKKYSKEIGNPTEEDLYALRQKVKEKIL
jgi:hypothetical protein